MYGDMLYTFNCFEKLLIVPFILVFLAVINVEFPFCAPCVSRSWQRRQQQECQLRVEEDEDTLVVGGLRFEVASSRESLQRLSLQAGDRGHHDNVWLMATIAAPVRARLQGQMTGWG